MAVFGIPLTIGASIATYTKPSYRNWLTSKRGYNNRISLLPGLTNTTPSVQALVTAIYLLIATFISIGLMFPAFTQNPRSVIGLSPIGLGILYGIFIQGWELPKKLISPRKQISSTSQHEAELKNLIAINTRRLQKLKEKQAIYGIAADPSILLEIEDIEQNILRLQQIRDNRK